MIDFKMLSDYLSKFCEFQSKSFEHNEQHGGPWWHSVGITWMPDSWMGDGLPYHLEGPSCIRKGKNSNFT